MVIHIYGSLVKNGGYKCLYIGLRLQAPLNTIMTVRLLCSVCEKQPRAVAYHKYDRTYYRSRCNGCIRKQKKLKPQRPRWEESGYKKKPACDRCGFRAKQAALQLMVYHVDGNLNNSELRNLKTVCLNCAAVLTRQEPLWRRGDLEPDH